MILYTASNSIYEVDLISKKIRRLSGERNATSRQGSDGEWKIHRSLFPVVPTTGSSLVICWNSDVELPTGSDVNSLPTTITSPIIRIVDDNSVLN